MPKQLIKVFMFDKEATATLIEDEINHWLCVTEAKIINVICNPPGAFDRYVVYNIVYTIEE